MKPSCQKFTKNRLLHIYQLPEMSPCVTQPVNKSDYKTDILSSLTYGSEVWSTSKDAVNKLEIFQKRVLT